MRRRAITALVALTLISGLGAGLAYADPVVGADDATGNPAIEQQMAQTLEAANSGSLEQQAIEGPSEAVPAPLVNCGSDKTKSENITEACGLSIDQFNISETQSLMQYSATALQKHYNAEGIYAYWAGIGVPYAGEGYTFASGFDSEFADDDYGPAEATFTQDGKTYSSFYFGTYAPTLPEKLGWISVKKDGVVVATYCVFFTGVTCVGDAAAAPASDRSGTDWAEGTDITEACGIAMGDQNVAARHDRVKLTATALQKHHNAQGMYAYWIGIGVPYGEGYSFAGGWGDYDANAEYTFEAADGSFNKDDVDYSSFYFGSYTPKFEQKKAFIAVKNNTSGNVVCVYDIDLSGVMCAGDAVLAPLVDHGNGTDPDPNTDMTPANYAATQTAAQGIDSIVFNGEGLKAHYNGQHVKKHWVGVGIPYTSETDVLYAGYGAYPEGGPTGDPAGTGSVDFTKDGVDYTSIYLDNAKLKAQDGFWICVKNGNSVVAKYQLTSEVTNTYNIEYAACLNGEVSGVAEAIEGTKGVEIVATPDEGYYAKSASVVDGAGQEVAVENWAYIMPSSDVTVSAVFAEQAGIAVGAPLVDHGDGTGEDPGTVVTPEDYATDTAINETDGSLAIITLSGTGVPKHYNAPHTAGYWVGFGIPYTNGETLESVFSKTAPDDETQWTTIGTATNDFQVGDKNYTTIYFDNANRKDKVAKDGDWYLRVKRGDEAVATYKVITEVKNSNPLTYADAEHGMVSGNRSATESDKVELTVEPEKYYGVVSVAAVDAKGNDVPVAGDPDEGFSLVMPSRTVTVSALFDVDATPQIDAAEQLLADIKAGKASLADADKKALQDAIDDTRAKIKAGELTVQDVAALDEAVETAQGAAAGELDKAKKAVDELVTAVDKAIAGAAVSTDGKDIPPSSTWITASAKKAYEDAKTAYNAATATFDQVTAMKKAAEDAQAAVKPGTKGAAEQTVTTKNKKVTVKAKKLQKGAVKVKAAKVTDGNSASSGSPLVYSKVKVNKKAGKFKVAKDGTITVKKGIKKGTYKVTVKAAAAGTTDYQPAENTFVVRIKVK